MENSLNAKHIQKKKRIIRIGLTMIAMAFSILFSKENGQAAGETEIRTEMFFNFQGNPSELTIHFLDVGEASCALITCDGENMLFDTGSNDSADSVTQYIKNQGIEHFKYVIGSHLDIDHIGGMDVILDNFSYDNILLPNYEKETNSYQDVLKVIDLRKSIITRPIVGNTYTLGYGKFTVLAPNSYDYDGVSNNYSICILLQHGNKRFLFTGDAEKPAEKDILKNNIIINADVYVAGHHGSRSSSSEDFVNAVNPKFAIISCGEGNDFGFPDSEVLNRFRKDGIKVFRTDKQGTIVVKSDGNSLTWNMDPDESWQPGQ